MKLSDYAKKLGITYRTAWDMFNRDEIPNAYKLKSGTIIVPETNETNKKDFTVTYARVSASSNKSQLTTQSKRLQDFCIANGWIVDKVVEETGSGLNDSRTKLQALFNDPKITRVVVEHSDRLTRFGFNYLKQLWDVEIVVINKAKTDEDDLMQDFVSVTTSLVARLYGKRRSKRQTESIIKELTK